MPPRVPRANGRVLVRAVMWSLPFLVLFQVGYLYVGIMSLLQGRFERLFAGSPSTASAEAAGVSQG